MTSPRRTLRPPVGIPSRRRRGWQGTLASVLVHAAVIALLLSPGAHAGFSGTPATGGGGPGTAGGGGGGGGGPRHAGERLQFVTIPRPRVAAPEPVVKADVSEVRPPVTPTPAPPTAPMALAPTAPISGAAAGEGSGAGTGGAGEGAGPGSGGGVGSGVGTGRGSGSGPGTGGGPGDIYPPTPTQFFLPPLPAPDRIKPYHLIAWFDVDERGNATLLHFNPSRDAGYNRRLRDVLLTLRFRPAVKADGTPVRDTVDIHYIF